MLYEQFLFHEDEERRPEQYSAMGATRRSRVRESERLGGGKRKGNKDRGCGGKERGEGTWGGKGERGPCCNNVATGLQQTVRVLYNLSVMPLITSCAFLS